MPTTFLSGSSTESNLQIDISSMSNGFHSVLNGWAIQNGGVAFVADDDEEKINVGFNNCIGPRILIVFVGEEPYGDEQVSDLVCMVKRNWDIIVGRGKTLTNPRNLVLTNTIGSARPFYKLVEEVRDISRAIAFPQPMCYSPNIYNGMRPLSSDNWLMDSYALSISVLCQIPRIQYQDAAITGAGNFVNLVDPPLFFQNSTPGANFI